MLHTEAVADKLMKHKHYSIILLQLYTLNTASFVNGGVKTVVSKYALFGHFIESPFYSPVESDS